MANDLLLCKVSAPGKIILHGEHSVVYGKTAIAASLGLRTTVKIQEKKTSGEPNIIVDLTNLRFTISFSIRSLQQSLLLIPILTTDKKFTWLTPETIDHDKYLKTIKEFLEEHKSKYQINMSEVQFQGMTIVLYLYCGILNKFDSKTNIELTVDSGLTIGAGTGSSASFAVSLAACMLHYLSMQQSDLYFSTLNANEDVKKCDLENFNITEKNLISKWAFCCEKIAHGNPSGVDNAACTFGSLVEFKKGANPIPHAMNFTLRVLLVDSRVSRQTKDLVQRVVDMRKRHPGVVDGVMETLNKVALSALKVFQKMNEGKDMDDQYEQLAELFEINHNLLVTLNVSHASLEKIRTTSAKFDLRTKLTGAGGGGFAIVLVPDGYDQERLTKLIHTLNGIGFNAKLTEIGGEGVTIH